MNEPAGELDDMCIGGYQNIQNTIDRSGYLSKKALKEEYEMKMQQWLVQPLRRGVVEF